LENQKRLKRQARPASRPAREAKALTISRAAADGFGHRRSVRGLLFEKLIVRLFLAIQRESTYNA
jgi:hypothetical protein